MKTYTVRKRPVSGVSRENGAKRRMTGAIYVPHHFINHRVVILDAMQHTRMERMCRLVRKVQRIVEEPWIAS